MMKKLLMVLLSLPGLVLADPNSLSSDQNNLKTIKNYKVKCVAKAQTQSEVSQCLWNATHAAIESADRLNNLTNGGNPDETDVSVAVRKIYQSCNSFQDTKLGAFAISYEEECKFYAATTYLEIMESIGN